MYGLAGESKRGSFTDTENAFPSRNAGTSPAIRLAFFIDETNDN